MDKKIKKKTAKHPWVYVKILPVGRMKRSNTINISEMF